jgi:hypothetical protein
LLHFRLITITPESSSYQAFHSFHEEIQSEFPILVKTQILFLSLAESITQTLSVTLCYVCGEMNVGEHWPWEAKELNPQSPLMKPLPQPWGEHLAPKILYYWELLYLQSKRPILQFSSLICLRQKFYIDATHDTQWWGAPNHTDPQPHPLASTVTQSE